MRPTPSLGPVVVLVVVAAALLAGAAFAAVESLTLGPGACVPAPVDPPEVDPVLTNGYPECEQVRKSLQVAAGSMIVVGGGLLLIGGQRIQTRERRLEAASRKRNDQE